MSEMPENPSQTSVDPELAPVDDWASEPASTDAGSTDYPIAPDGETTAHDVDGNGLVDSLFVTYADGAWIGAFDVTEDGAADVFAVSTTGAADPDFFVLEDGAGGYIMQVDTDGDGVPDTDVPRTRAELEVEFPAALEYLDLQFTAASEATPATPVDPVGSEPAGTVAPAPDEWTVSDGQLIGDPGGASEHWFEQAVNGFCVPASIAQMVGVYTGTEITDESFFVERANELHLFTVGMDGSPSMTAEGAAALLVDVGIDAHVESDLTILDLENFLDEGRPVMLAVDADEMWYGEADSVDDAANHAVVLTGIDPVNGVAILSDPGSPTGDQYTMPISELDRMWEDSDRQAVVVDLPADGSGQAPVADPVSLDPSLTAAATSTGDAGVGAAPTGSTSVSDLLEANTSPVDSTIEWLMRHPYVIIPVVVAAGALTRRQR